MSVSRVQPHMSLLKSQSIGKEQGPGIKLMSSMSTDDDVSETGHLEKTC